VVSGALASAADAIAQRTAERERKEHQLRLLINELNHRVKNSLATVQSIASQTLRGPVSIDDARQGMIQRLMAIAGVHDALTQENWEGADLHGLLTGVMRQHGTSRFVVDGPPVRLTPQVALSLGFALHELGTNAAKYGALSTDKGSVTVSWQVDDVVGMPWLRLRWVERGGPLVQPPTHQGFGSKLIQRSLSGEAGAKVTMDFAPEGLTCVMATPMRPGAPSTAFGHDGEISRSASNS
jgi:two-component sensor histidine kinase